MPAFPPSNSYGVRVQSRDVMKRSVHPSRHAGELDVRRLAGRQRSRVTDDQATPAFPQPGAILAEIGLILAVHLAVAIAVTLTLRAFGIA